MFQRLDTLTLWIAGLILIVISALLFMESLQMVEVPGFGGPPPAAVAGEAAPAQTTTDTATTTSSGGSDDVSSQPEGSNESPGEAPAVAPTAATP